MKTRELKFGFNKKRLILFIVVIVIAVGSLGYGITQLLKDDSSGWTTINVVSIKDVNNENITPYNLEVLLYYYLDGNKSGRNQIIKEVTKDFNYALSEYHILFDANYSYLKDEEIVYNLNYINHNPNIEIEVNPNLYNALKQAYQYTLDTDGIFNVFGGELSYYYLVKVLDIGNDDPIDNPEGLKVITDKIDDYKDGKFDLIFNDENYSVMFFVQEGYDLEHVQIDLQFLSQAYAIDGVKNYLIGKGYESGFISSTFYDFYSMLGSNPAPKTGGFWRNPISHPHSTYSTPSYVAEFLMNQAHNSVEIGYLASRLNNRVKDNDLIFHPFYNAKTGMPSNEYHLVSINSLDSITNAVKDAFQLFNLSSEDQAQFINENSDADTYYIILENQGSNKTGSDDLQIRASMNLETYSQYQRNDKYEVEYLYLD